MAMESPCPFRTKKRPMSRNGKAFQGTAKHLSSFLLLCAIIWSCTQNSVFAQTAANLLTGTITDQNGQPLIGATITETQNKTTVQTDAKGNFKLPTQKNSGTLQISYLGYQTQTISYQTNKALNIQLSEDPSTLKAVEINTGYYSVKKALMTGSISSISAKDIEKQPVANPLSTLQGRMAGVYVSQSNGTPGSTVNLEIRGKSSIEASGNPLYILDGVPFNSQPMTSELSVSSTVYSNGGASPLNSIAPENIASIEVLKDADATAIYGSRGSNGVVLITTKKGQSGQTKIDFNAYSGISQVTRKLQLLNTQQYLDMRRQALANDNLSPRPTHYDINGTWDQNAQTDWQQELIGGTARFNNAHLSFSGGNNQSSFILSGSYNDQGSVFQGNLGYQRASVHLGASTSSKDQRLKLSFSANYSHDRSNWLNNDFTARALSLAPNAPSLRKADGSLNWANSTWINPLRELEGKYQSSNNVLVANANLSYQLATGLELKTSLGYTLHLLDDHTLNPVSFYDPAEGRTPALSYADFNDSKLYSWIAEPQLNYQKSTSFGRFAITTGMSLQRQLKTQLAIRATGFVSDALLENPQASQTNQIRGYQHQLYKYAGTYARVNYNLKERYILNLTGRRDGSSRFGPGRQFANFGAIGAAYIFSEENIVKNTLPFLSFGKLRLSYGTSGNDQIGDYEFLNTFQPSAGYQGLTGLSAVRLYNPDFGWEINRKFEVGLHLNFFKDRLRSTFSYYSNRSSNQLIDYPLALTTGFASIRNNLPATVSNTGLEIELSSTNLSKGRLQWESSFNLTIPKNRLIAFPGLAHSSYADRYAIGYSLNVAKVFRLIDVDPQTGIYRYEDANGDGSISYASDRQHLVEKGQKFFGGLDNSFRYGNLEFSFFFQFVKQTANLFSYGSSATPGGMSNQPLAYAGQYWTQPGDLKPYQRLTTGANAAAATAFSNYYYSDRSIGDASFVRLRNVSLSYRNQQLIPGKSLRIYFQGQNLWTITNYFGMDPETASNVLPPLKTFTLGLQLSL